MCFRGAWHLQGALGDIILYAPVVLINDQYSRIRAAEAARIRDTRLATVAALHGRAAAEDAGEVPGGRRAY